MLFSAKAPRLHEVEVRDKYLPILTVTLGSGTVFRLTYKDGGLAQGHGMAGMLVAYEDDIEENWGLKAPGHRRLGMR